MMAHLGFGASSEGNTILFVYLYMRNCRQFTIASDLVQDLLTVCLGYWAQHPTAGVASGGGPGLALAELVLLASLGTTCLSLSPT